MIEIKSYIKKVLNKENQSLEDLINCLETIKNIGHVAVIKFDGERVQNLYTVFITLSDKKGKMIRVDGDNLKDSLIKSLKEYIKPDNL
ncbi:MAG TPA: hypothetical protein VIM65_19865 [Cyclobacteriaceae bacterium]